MTYNEAKEMAETVADSLTHGSRKCVIAVLALTEIFDIEAEISESKWSATFVCTQCGEMVMCELPIDPLP